MESLDPSGASGSDSHPGDIAAFKEFTLYLACVFGVMG